MENEPEQFEWLVHVPSALQEIFLIKFPSVHLYPVMHVMVTEIGYPVCAGFEPEENIWFRKSKFDIGFPQSTAELQRISFSQFELSNRIK